MEKGSPPIIWFTKMIAEDIVLDFTKVVTEPASLDKEQAYVVGLNKSEVVVAGPGSGKTRVLTEKARKLFDRGENILCLCFTRAAAHEMSLRVPMLPATTIHSYCCSIVGWKEEWGYEGLLYRFLKSTDKIRYSWILVDEVQDLNQMEFDVVLSLVGDKIFAVGDPYQSIYGFQGAMGPEVIDRLERLGCKKIDLHNNYRSNEEMVRKINKVFDRGLISMGGKRVGMNAILCRKNEDLFYVSRELKTNGIPHKIRLSAEYGTGREYDVGEGKNKLVVSTIHSSKGREFDRVYLFDWLPQERGEEERVYYVGMSRASQEFTCVGTIKELLRGLGTPRETSASMPYANASPSDYAADLA